MQKKLRRPFGLGLKAFFIIILILLLWIPLLVIGNLVDERKGLQREVVNDIAQSTSKEQLITGPILVLPYRKIERHLKTLDDGSRVQEEREVRGRRYFLPDSFNYQGQFSAEQLKRGIYQARLYKNNGNISGHFVLPAQLGIGENIADYQFEQAFIAIGISDVRGIRNTIKASIGKNDQSQQPLQFEPGSGEPGLGSGIHAPLVDLKVDDKAQRLDFTINLDLQGTSRFQLNPVGRETTVFLESDWPHPSFFGNFLPIDREVTAAGFKAHWKTNFFATNMEDRLFEHLRKCTAKNTDCDDRNYGSGFARNIFHEQSFGVNFIEPVDQYRKTDRAIKYGLLFIGLTFAVFFLFEVLKRLPIHPMQYVMVGFALALFYLLLLSLSEHIGFLLAYCVSAGACVLLIGIYVSSVLHSLKRGGALSGLLIALYALLYSLLGAEDYALLIGSILVFGLLAVVMLLTRKLDWYAFSRKEDY